ncbi:MAG: retropepsin-like aspartic protease [Nitrosospira sp.]
MRGKINGHPMDFMVDTGASTVSISRDIALNAHLPRGMPATFLTANGPVRGEIVSGQTIEAGGIVVEGLSVGIGVQGNVAREWIQHKPRFIVSVWGSVFRGM